MIDISVEQGVVLDSADVNAICRVLGSLPFSGGQTCSVRFSTSGNGLAVVVKVPNGLGSGTCSRCFAVSANSCQQIKSWLREHFTERRRLFEEAATACSLLVEALKEAATLSA